MKFRATASKTGLAKLAEKIVEHNFHALLIIGGYEVRQNLKHDLINNRISFRHIYQFSKCMKHEVNIQHFKFH
jgi:hypothetical protein